MNKKILNFIIFISLSGILIISIRDYYNEKKFFNNKNNLPLSILTPTIKTSQNLDSPVLCQNKYFNFKKGTFWFYKLTLNENNNKKNRIETFFSNKIVESSRSSAVIEMELEKKKKRTTVVCKKSGIYGYPFPLLIDFLVDDLFKNEQLKTKKNFLSLLNQEASFMIMPEEGRLKKNNEWETSFFPPFFSLKNKIIEEKKQSILDLGIINTLTVKTKLKFDQFFLKPEIFSYQLTYQLGEKIGFLNFNFNLNLNRSKEIKLVFTLLEFKENKENEDNH